MYNRLFLSELNRDMLTDELIDKILYDAGGKNDSIPKADIIIVPGSCKAWEYRVPDAAALYIAGCAPFILLSGGKVQQSKFGLLPEWKSMLTAAEKLGVPRSAILTEERSLCTVENFRFSSRIIYDKLPDCRSAAVVTIAYHMRRAMLIAEREIPDIKLIPIPVQKGSASRENWRETPKGRSTAAEEVLKISRYAANGIIADRKLSELFS